MKLLVTRDVAATAGALVRDAVVASVERRGRCRLALSGGSTPGPLYRWLGQHLDPALFPFLVVTFADERHLPLASGWPEDSNVGLAWRTLLADTGIQVVPMLAGGSLEEDRDLFERRFHAELGGLDVVVLGVGPDGHVASLFPGHPALDARGGCVALGDSPKPPPERLSLTLDVLEDVDHAFILATGAAKAPALARARAGDRHLPLGRYNPRGVAVWVLDPEAAALTTEQP